VAAWSAVADELVKLVPDLLHRNTRVTAVELRGSRARGTAGRFSDWDFVLFTDDFAGLAADLPALVGGLSPLVQQWDRLSDTACYMLIVTGPTKIDLIFEDVPHEHEPPWSVGRGTLAAIDHHFWDWALWLTSKVDAGKSEMVSAELDKMHEHLLSPLGCPGPPASLREAVEHYTQARDSWVKRLGASLDPRIAQEVAPVVDAVCRK